MWVFGSRVILTPQPYPHLLLLSWNVQPDQLASALVALGGLADVRGCESPKGASRARPAPSNKDTSASTSATNQPPWLIARWPSSASAEGAPNCPTNFQQLSDVDLQVIRVAGMPTFTGSVLEQAATLAAKEPELYLLPRLFFPLPPPGDQADWQQNNYIGAALDDDLQPDSKASCVLRTLTAGIFPLALHSVIVPWLKRRALSGTRRKTNRQASPRQKHAGPTTASSLPPSSPATHQAPLNQAAPVNQPLTSPAPQPSRAALPPAQTHSTTPLSRPATVPPNPQPKVANQRRPRVDPVSFTTTLLQNSASMWTR